MADTLKWRVAAILILALILNLNGVKASEEVMKKMSKTFFKVMDECKKELSISNDMVQSLVKFWGEGSDHEDRELGCMILCMAHKQDLLHYEQYRLHHQNAYQFAKDHGADEATAKQIMTIVHECEEKFATNEDHCARAMEVSRCFRDHMHRLQWAPSVDVLVGEILVEMA
ncbi:hypothetical protein ABMA28_006604 [Loxostege sticticalis]|uniref:Pheromone binding protein 3 n=1 Tax=Loxostege sticticalis TaxID=481309 RepID=A0ABD0SLQ7_LOXSC